MTEVVPNQNKPVYVGYFLDEESKKKLLSTTPARHQIIHADHVTLAFGRHMEPMEFYKIGDVVELKVICELYDERGHCLAIEPEPISKWLAKNQSPHITISCAPGIKPIYSNELLKDTGPKVIHRGFGHYQEYKLKAVMDFFPRTIKNA